MVSCTYLFIYRYGCVYSDVEAKSSHAVLMGLDQLSAVFFAFFNDTLVTSSAGFRAGAARLALFLSWLLWIDFAGGSSSRCFVHRFVVLSRKNQVLHHRMT